MNVREWTLCRLFESSLFTGAHEYNVQFYTRRSFDCFFFRLGAEFFFRSVFKTKFDQEPQTKTKSTISRTQNGNRRGIKKRPALQRK